MDPMNFNILRRNDARESNYTLRDKKVQLTVTCQPLYETPDAGVWEGEGGALPPASYEETVEEVNKRTMRIRGARKQRAARHLKTIAHVHAFLQGLRYRMFDSWTVEK